MTAPGTTDEPRVAREVRLPADAAVLDLVLAWAPQQRWFPAKGTVTAPTPLAVVELQDPLAEATVQVHLLRLPSGGVLQVPVTIRPAPATGGIIGEVLHEGERRAVLDGPHDRAFVRAWLAAAQWDGTAFAVDDDVLDGSRVLSGEQSNTSVLLPATDPPAILKVFRGVSTGPNPDVEVPLALSRRWDGVPRPLAWLTGAWPARPGGRADEATVGHLGVLSELVPGARDGFELACRLAHEGQDMADLAEDLGRTTAAMHRALREALPVADAPGTTAASPPPAEARQVVSLLRARAAATLRDAPVLRDRSEQIDAVLGGVARLGDLPPLQRVHGDYHLGQVLHSVRGWSVLDFEGEPAAPAAERTRPDLALRDVAGMLRSVDYAAAVGGATDPAWAASARERLVTGYLAHDGRPPEAAGTTRGLLRALELDKALYEVVYESGHRPGWVHIPLEGVDRLLAESP